MDLPTVRRDDFAGDGQAQAGATRAITGLAGLHKGLKNGLQLGRRDARALVADLDVDAVVARDACGDLNGAVFGGELHGVGQHVAHHLLEA